MVIVKEIENLSELDGFEWSHNGRVLLIEYSTCSKSGYIYVKLKDTCRGTDRILLTLDITELIDLDFLGLRVKIAEKPKITTDEKILLDKMFFDDCYIARDKCGTIAIYPEKPFIRASQWCMDEANSCIRLTNDSFKFITWESLKAWTKEELLKLEVME